MVKKAKKSKKDITTNVKYEITIVVRMHPYSTDSETYTSLEMAEKKFKLLCTVWNYVKLEKVIEHRKLIKQVVGQHV